MRDLKSRLQELESRVIELGGTPIKRDASVACDCSEDGDEVVESQASRPSSHPAGTARSIRSVKRKYDETSTTPPSPSSSPDRQPSRTLVPLKGSMTTNITESPDPNETEAEVNLPPPLTVASRSSSHSSTSSHPSITSLLNSANRPAQPPPSSRPAAPPQAANPTLYLPFPTPSPTSPFLTYPSGTSSSSTSTSTSGPTEPSPFMAPLQNFSLFGGAISLDPAVSPEVRQYHTYHPNASGSRSPPDLSMPPPKSTREGGGKAVPSSEEAANLLLAFSSPDTLRPVSGGTPVFAPHGHRRGTLDAEDFSLDGGHASGPTGRRRESQSQWGRPIAGKTARDILRM